jgi:hypothetical protein
MNAGDVISKCRWVITDAGFVDTDITAASFLDYSNFVRDIIQGWSRAKKQETPWLREFAENLRRLRDQFLDEVQSDPMILYKPAHDAALDFHQSTALIRYFRAANRCSKTQTGVADNYWILTDQHPYRAAAPLPSRVAIIGTNFTKYCPSVFESKYLHGEGGNPLSPIFPEGGKWFNRYDTRKHIIYIACPQCAEARKAQECKHAKSALILFSDEEGPLVLAGAQYAQIQFDEQISREFFPESQERIKTVPNSGIIVTETPLGGKGFWTHTELTTKAENKEKVHGTDQLLVSLHSIDQFSAGLIPHDRIHASMAMMSAEEAEARVYGRPAAFSKTGVFDKWEISNMFGECSEPTRGVLALEQEKVTKNTHDALFMVKMGDRPKFQEVPDEALRIWEMPESAYQYVIGADVAQGLTNGDYSCASVLKMSFAGHDLEFAMVAQLHGWINPRTYAEEVMKLAMFYNDAILVVERTGPGAETIRSLREWGYWNMFRDHSDPADNEFNQDSLLGIDTNMRTKSVMISVLQQTIKDKRTQKRTIRVPCRQTIDELGSYGQERTPSGHSIKFRGESGMPDDRVMSLVFAVYAAKAFGTFDYNLDAKLKAEAAMKELSGYERSVWESHYKAMEQSYE